MLQCVVVNVRHVLAKVTAMIVGNPEHDFFEQNGTLRYVTEFADLIQQHGQESASRIAWAVYMVEAPGSPMFNLPIKDRVEEVKLNYGIDVTEHEDFRKVFRRFALSKEELMFKVHLEKMDELTASVDNLDTTIPSELKLYLSIMDKIPKIWNALDKVRQTMFDSNSKKMYGEGARTHREKRFS